MGRSAQIPRLAAQLDGDDSGSPVLHVDMDAFFASVEVQARPELAGRPVVVGGRERGVVAAASYEARRFGVRSAMPMSQALRLCPQAVVLPPNRAAYIAASAAVMAILREVTELVEPLSLDEAFLDVSGAVRRMGRPGEIARWIRARVHADLGLTCSVGVAPTKFVAKVASARSKPDGLLVVPAAGVVEFLHPLPVTALWGVGDRTAEALHRLGVRSVGDLAGLPADTLRRAVGSAAAAHLAALAVGDDPRPVVPDVGEKSISSDRTLAEDLLEESAVAAQLLDLAGDVGRRLRDRTLVGRTVGIKIRFADFRTVTRSRTLPTPTDSDAAIYAAALALYRGLDLDRPRIRLVGVKAEGLRDPAGVTEQLSLLDLPTADGGRGAGSASRPLPPSTGSSGGVGSSGGGPEIAGPTSPLPSPSTPSPPSPASVTARPPAPDPEGVRPTSPRPAAARPRSAPATPAAARDDPLDAARDAARRRFGDGAVRPATLVRPQARRPPSGPAPT